MPAAKKTARNAMKRTAPKPAKRAATRTLSPSHKAALAEGRTLSATVDHYLSAVNTPKRRGRKVARGALEQRLTKAQQELRSGTGVTKVLLAQEVRDLQARLAQLASSAGADVKSLEADFVKIAKRFGEQRGIGYGAWRDAGVPADVLKRAGIARTRG